MSQKTSHNRLWPLCTLLVLGVSYWFCRFAMLDFHGMKQWPTLLCVVAFAVLMLSLIFKKHWLSAATNLGYLGGFGIAILFNSDHIDAAGVPSNNLWIIWAAILLACILIGVVIELVRNSS